jgi:hypothetical protein
MFTIILVIHLFAGILSILSSLSNLITPIRKIRSTFWPSVATVTTSGFVLMLMGSSILRVCISGLVLTISLVVLHKISNKKAELTKVTNQ